MSDISFYGLVAVLVFMALAVVTALSAIVFLILAFGFGKRRLTGFFYASLVAGAFSLMAMFLIDGANTTTRQLMDDVSPFVAILIVTIIVVVGLRYRKRH